MPKLTGGRPPPAQPPDPFRDGHTRLFWIIPGSGSPRIRWTRPWNPTKPEGALLSFWTPLAVSSGAALALALWALRKLPARWACPQCHHATSPVKNAWLRPLGRWLAAPLVRAVSLVRDQSAESLARPHRSAPGWDRAIPLQVQVGRDPIPGRADRGSSRDPPELSRPSLRVPVGPEHRRSGRVPLGKRPTIRCGTPGSPGSPGVPETRRILYLETGRAIGGGRPRVPLGRLRGDVHLRCS